MTNEPSTSSESHSRLRRALQLFATLTALLLVAVGCANAPLSNDAVVDQRINNEEITDDAAADEETLGNDATEPVDAARPESTNDEAVAEEVTSQPATMPEGGDPFGGGSDAEAPSEAAPSQNSTSESNEPDLPDFSETVTEQTAVPAVASVPETLAFSADATAKFSTLLFSFDVRMGMTDEVLEMRGQGAIDGQNLALQMDLEGLVEAMGGDVDRETRRLFEEPMTLVTDQTNVFVKWKPLTELNGHGDRWIYLPVEADAAPIIDPTAFDPGTFLDLLRGASDDVTMVGTKQLDGVTVTGYSGTFSVDDQLQSAIDASSGAAELGDVTTTVWIDEDNITRQMETDYVMLGLAYQSKMTFSGFGEPVNIDVPSIADAISAEDIEGFLE